MIYGSAPEGMNLKKSSAINLQLGEEEMIVFVFSSFSRTFFFALSIAYGKSNNISCMFRLFFNMVDKSIPCPPPISASVLDYEKSCIEDLHRFTVLWSLNACR